MMYHAICSKNNATLGIGVVVILRAGEQLIRLQMECVVWGEGGRFDKKTIMFSEWDETGEMVNKNKYPRSDGVTDVLHNICTFLCFYVCMSVASV